MGNGTIMELINRRQYWKISRLFYRFIIVNWCFRGVGLILDIRVLCDVFLFLGLLWEMQRQCNGLQNDKLDSILVPRSIAELYTWFVENLCPTLLALLAMEAGEDFWQWNIGIFLRIYIFGSFNVTISSLWCLVKEWIYSCT